MNFPYNRDEPCLEIYTQLLEGFKFVKEGTATTLYGLKIGGKKCDGESFSPNTMCAHACCICT
jgi:hypothetical protein